MQEIKRQMKFDGHARHLIAAVEKEMCNQWKELMKTVPSSKT